MNLTKCNNGHYYDADKFDNCPHCDGGNAVNNMPEMGDETVDMDYQTAPATPIVEPPTEPLTGMTPVNRPTSRTAAPVEDIEMTVGIGSYFNEEKHIKIEPVVGWLVCIEGSDYGASFNLKAGKNFVGRGAAANDIVLKGDQGVSREKHAIIVYDPKSKAFMAQPGLSSELFYVNDAVILQATILNAKDVISIGNTKLMFVPFCGPDFTW